MDFETYWETIGSRIQVDSHEERARLAWEAAYKEGINRGKELEQEEQRFNDWEDACMAASQ